jgi:hypothetical protein
MAEAITEEILEIAAEEVANYSDDEARSEMERISKLQPALLAYVMASTEDLRTEAQEIALYVFVVIHKAFENQFATRLQNAGMKRVEQICDANDEALEKMVGNEEDIMNAAMLYAQKQPTLFGYITEWLLEPEDDEVELSEDDQSAVTMILKNAIDVLDSSVRSEL